MRITYRKVIFSATRYMQKKPLAQPIRRFEERIPGERDSGAEHSDFEPSGDFLWQPGDKARPRGYRERRRDRASERPIPRRTP